MKNQNFKNKLIFGITILIGSITFFNTALAGNTTINFANYDWGIKNASTAGPGPNSWSNSNRTVFLDDQKRLHLTVSQLDGQWYSSEVFLLSSLGYGRYTFDIDSRLDLLDKNLVAAPFLYQNDTHEIDIEHSFWSNTSSDKNLYYTVQPYDKEGNQQTQHSDLSDTTFQDIIYWEPNKITLSTEQNGNTLSTWTYTSSTDGTTDNFIPGNESVHINFWQYQGLIPLDASSTHEFIVKNFSFIPLEAPPSKSTSTPNITTISATTSSITIYWDEVFEATSYEVSSTIMTNVPSVQTSTTFIELTPNTEYFFQVREFNGTDYSDFTTVFSTTTLAIPTSTTTDNSTSTNQGGSGGSGGTSNNQTNTPISSSQITDTVNKLINYLKTNQTLDGKIIDGGISDWATISFGAKGIYASDIKSEDKNLYDFIYDYNFTDISDMNICASYPRHILALLSSGTSKTDSKIIALKNKINTECIKDNIFGQSGINDDVFGLIAALALDEISTSPVVSITTKTIIDDQKANGAFTSFGSESADITGAAINALKYAQSKNVTVDNNIFSIAELYLKSQQLADGGWGCPASEWDGVKYPACTESDATTVSWVVMGINSLGKTQNDWFNSTGKNPWYFLTTLDNDHYSSWGSVDWFGTKHAIPALLGKSWPIILDPKPATPITSNGGGSATPLATTTIITPTTTLSTTTIATSTITTTTTIIATTTTIPTTTVIVDANTTTTIKTIAKTKPENKIIATTPKSIGKQPESKPQQELSVGKPQVTEDKTLDNLPLDTPTKRTAKKVLAISGGSALLVAGYLGLRLLRNVV